MKEKIIKLRNDGYSYNEISKRLNCSKGTISYHCSKLCNNDEIVKINNLSKNEFIDLTKDEIKEIIKLRKNKKPYKEIRAILNISLYKIRIVCQRNNLSKSRKNGSLDEKKIKEIKELYNELKNMRKVAKQLNVSIDSVRKHVVIIKKKKLTEEEFKKHNVKSVIEWRKRKKVELVEYKGGKCEICGYNKSIRALQFHHINPSKKDFTVGGKSWSFERLKKEVDKCILVCSNCHLEIHEEIENDKEMKNMKN